MKPGIRESIPVGRRFPPAGAALVVVMVLLALMLMLVLATLQISRVPVERQSLLAASLQAEALAQLPATIVLSQLRRATTLEKATDGERLLWTSQPGMIRSYGTTPGKDGAAPAARMHYRLYSAPVMNTSEFHAADEATTLRNWINRPLVFTDLNQPVMGQDGSLKFPIADPSLLGQIDGYSLRADGPVPSTRHPLPLPVAWIYVLRDGRMLVPASEDGEVVRFDPAQVNSTNPIIGRIAFWTDDESCKLNINTATAPEPWDRAAANTETELGWARRVPARARTCAQSWHSAFTSLSPVIKHFGAGTPDRVQWPPPDPVDPLSPESRVRWQRYAACYQALAPDGSLAGDGKGWQSKQDRLYGTVDELFLSPDRTGNAEREGFEIKAGDMDRARFLLTTRSSAPELNPFGQPKIALWMLPMDAAQRSPWDRQVAALSSLGKDHEFVFQRASGWEGTGKQGASQSPTADWSEVARNRELFAWLQRLTAEPLPGFGSSLAGKYGVRSRDQILFSMLDMLRWGVNSEGYLPPSDASNHGSAVPLILPNADGSARARGFGRFPTVVEVALVFAFTDVERVGGLPLDANHDGICDRATKLRALVVINPFFPASGPPSVGAAWSVRIRRLQHFTIGQGISLLLPGGNARNRCTLSSTMPVPGTGVPWGGGHSAYAGFASQFVQPDGTAKRIGQRADPARDFPFISSADVTLPAGAGAPGTGIRFSGGAIVVDLMEPDSALTSPRPNDAIHSLEMEFPEQNLPMPRLLVEDFLQGPRRLDDRLQPLVIAGEARVPVIQRGDVVRSMVFNGQGPSGGDARLLAARRDVLFESDAANRHEFVMHPDAVPDSPLPDQWETQLQAQSLRDGAHLITGQFGGPQPRSTVDVAGRLLPGVTFADNAVPAVPKTLDGALQKAVGGDPGGRLGDWETSPGVLEDGAGINRSDHDPDAAFTRSGLSVVPGALPPASAAWFGGLPSGVYGDAADASPRPWQTLLFCPNPAGRTSPATGPGRYEREVHDHFGFASPHDHLWLEFFWQPVISPRPLSAGFATEGKVNLNFQIVPWNWLRRATALHGALAGIRMAAIPTRALMDQTESAKGHRDGSPLRRTFRYAVDAGRTLAAFERRFDRDEVFRTASEVCDMFLVPLRLEHHAYDAPGFETPDPAGLQAGDMVEWWNGKADDPSDAFEATGDNLREAPYSQLYPRVCTQSNVFRVHYRVQVLGKARSTAAHVFDPAHDTVTAERRGSVLVERRIRSDVLRDSIDPATDSAPPSLHTQEEFVTISHQPFGQ